MSLFDATGSNIFHAVIPVSVFAIMCPRSLETCIGSKELSVIKQRVSSTSCFTGVVGIGKEKSPLLGEGDGTVVNLGCDCGWLEKVS